MNFEHDPFTTLGLHPTATREELKRAYRRLAMHWHPDRNPSAAAESEFKRIKAAYELIIDPQAYAEWQQKRSATQAGAEPPEPPAPSAADVTQDISLSLEEAAHGCRKKIELAQSTRCRSCRGSGRVEHRTSVPCALCNGCGRVRNAGSRNGTHVCPGCAGRGYLRETACTDCAGSGWQTQRRTLDVRVPPGVLDGERLRLARQAKNAANGAHEAPSGDLYLAIRLVAHPLFTLHGHDLHCTVPISIFRLLLGGTIEVPTLAGLTTLDLPPGASPESVADTEFRLPGHGLPKKRGRGAGALLVHLHIVYPAGLGARDALWLEKLEAALHGDLAQRAPPLAGWADALARLRERGTA